MTRLDPLTLSFGPLSDVAMFTHRNGMTMMQIQEAIRDKLSELTSAHNEVVTHLEAVEGDLAVQLRTTLAELDGMISTTQTELDATLTYVNDAAVQAQEAVGLAAGAADHALSELIKNPAAEVRASLRDDYATGGEMRSKVKTDGTDQTATLQSELNTLATFGGGTLILPSGTIKVDGQIVMPTYSVTLTGASTQRSLAIVGQGGWHSGQIQTVPVIGGTTLLCGWQSADYNAAKIVTRGLGRLTIADLTLKSDIAADATPFIMTTATTLHVRGVSFRGAAANATLCAIDAIVFGGKKKLYGAEVGYGDPDAPYQGYGSVISGCYFDKVRRVMYGRSFCNHVVFRDSFVEKTCGTNLPLGACIEINGNLDPAPTQPGDYCTGDQILNNYMNGLGYYHQIKLVQATRCVVMGNGSPDVQANLVSLVGCYTGTESANNYPSTDNSIIGNHCQSAVHLYEDVNSTGRNSLWGGGQSEGTKLRGNIALEPGSQNPVQIGKVNLKDRITTTGDGAHEWTVPDPFTTGTAPWKVTAKTTGIDWLKLAQGAVPTFMIAANMKLTGANNAAGSTNLTVGDNANDSDSQIILNPPTGRNATIQWCYAGTNKWQIYNGAGATNLHIRDSANGVMALTFTQGATNTGIAAFAGKITAGGSIKTQAVATGSRPTASSAGAGAMIYDSTLSKPVWSDGAVWRDAMGTAV